MDGPILNIKQLMHSSKKTKILLSTNLVGLQANWTTSALWGLVKIGLSKFLVSHMTTVSSQYDATLYIRNYKLEDG